MHTATKIVIIVIIIVIIVVIIVIIIMHTAQRFNFSDGSYCSQELIQGSCTSNCILPEQFQSMYHLPFCLPFYLRHIACLLKPTQRLQLFLPPSKESQCIAMQGIVSLCIKRYIFL